MILFELIGLICIGIAMGMFLLEMFQYLKEYKPDWQLFALLGMNLLATILAVSVVYGDIREYQAKEEQSASVENTYVLK